MSIKTDQIVELSLTVGGAEVCLRLGGKLAKGASAAGADNNKGNSGEDGGGVDRQSVVSFRLAKSTIPSFSREFSTFIV